MAEPIIYRYKETFTKVDKLIDTKVLTIAFFVFGFATVFLTYGNVIYSEFWYMLKQIRFQEFVLYDSSAQKDSPFVRLFSAGKVNIEPPSNNFSIVIEKIGLTEPIQEDVLVSNEKKYLSALGNGIAHSSASHSPSDGPGTVFLVAHEPLSLIDKRSHSADFILLHRLEKGDNINVFYNGTRYIYSVLQKDVLPGWSVFPISRVTIDPLLVLQTSDPPGTTMNRLVVTATLIEVR